MEQKNLNSEQNKALIIQGKTQLILRMSGFYHFRETEKKVYWSSIYWMLILLHTKMQIGFIHIVIIILFISAHLEQKNRW